MTISILILTLTSCFYHLPHQEQNESPKIESVLYELRLIPRDDRTDLHVELTIFRTASGPLEIELPKDSGFGFPSIDRFLAKFVGMKDTTVSGDGIKRILSSPGKKPLRVQYVLSFDPAMIGSTSFGPNVGSRHFHAACAQWMLALGETSSIPTTIRWCDVPDGWRTYTSLDQNADEFSGPTTRQELARAMVGAISGCVHQFQTKGKPVSVFVLNEFESARHICEAVENIVRLQRQLFDDYSAPFYQITILPRPENVAGVAVENMFACFVKRDVTVLQLNMLVSHEMLHTWISDSRIDVGPNDTPAENFVRNQWFIEGVTDYLSRKILLDAGLMSQDEFVDSLNQDVVNIADNQYRNHKFTEIMELANAGKFGNEMAKLAYNRGALLALRWESLLVERSSSTTLTDIVSRIYKNAQSNGSRLTYRQFFDLFSETGLSAKEDVDRIILDGKDITLPEKPLQSDYKLQEVEIRLFDPGFDLAASRARKKVVGVDPLGPAYRAGLRNGMSIIRVSNGTRFSRAWESTKPITIAVQEEKTKKTVSYFPRGQRQNSNLYQNAK